MEILYGVIGAALILAGLIYLFIMWEGNAVFEVRTESRSPFVLDELTKDSVTVKTKVEFANTGKQCGTIMDCYVRHLLPYEHFDGVKVYAKAELEDAPRPDEYFEATLIQRQSSIQVWVKITLTARKCDDIKAALTEMVDMPVDLVYQYVARRPWAIDKKRIVLTAAELAALTGITLVDQ